LCSTRRSEITFAGIRCLITSTIRIRGTIATTVVTVIRITVVAVVGIVAVAAVITGRIIRMITSNGVA
jgi:hypothetical protein